LWLVVAVAVERGDAHELAAVVDVDELAERDDTHLCAGVASADADAHVLEADLSVSGDVAQQCARRIGGLVLVVGELQLAERCARGLSASSARQE
jgi:hypothetical protein